MLMNMVMFIEKPKKGIFSRLNTNNASSGYRTVSIRFEDGSRKLLYVHRLVASAFIPNPENKPVVNHKNLCKHDNRVENLEWVTSFENNRHAIENGCRIREDGVSFNAIYPYETIVLVCKLLSEGRRQVDIIKETGVSKSTVGQIYSRRVWTHISKDYFFPKKKRVVSDRTIRFICNKIVEGYSNFEISKMTDLKVSRQKVNQIRTKEIYKDISKDYF